MKIFKVRKHNALSQSHKIPVIEIKLYIYIYIRSPIRVEGIFGRRSHNTKVFERIEHSGSR